MSNFSSLKIIYGISSSSMQYWPNNRQSAPAINCYAIDFQIVFDRVSTVIYANSFVLDMLELAEHKYFSSGWPVKSTIALSSQQFSIVGELMVMSVLQGGPAPNFLNPSVYSYISKSQLDPNQNSCNLNRNVANNVSCFVSF